MQRVFFLVIAISLDTLTFGICENFCIFWTGGGDSNKGKSKKWRKILQFPHISQCIGLKDKLGESVIIEITKARNKKNKNFNRKHFT